ncbi:zinc-binding dehydrogenase [Desulfogranum japonicum]|uniref:zinc-binding dehydrogenase n=1 Tax=Desulfogranum japonicum TaxID=231447 RepID=UPI00048F02DF|nr:alcohol dehydrogenase catalytic domain-containing protein [Desulfogranum japonicum]
MHPTESREITFNACYIKGKHDLSISPKKLEYNPAEEVLVKISRGGICGSDIHYFQHGGVGDFLLKHPMVLGHEVIGTTEDPDTGQQVHVAVNPSRPCNACAFCLSGNSNLCLHMRFFGSAMLTPHVDGGFAEYVAVRPDQCVPYDGQKDDSIMAFCEPLAVAIHALNQAGNVLGKKILVTGSGPIGALIIAACRTAGAAEIIATDPVGKNRDLALTMGADRAYAPDDSVLAGFTDKKGYFDASFEASGAIPAIQANIDYTKAGGTMIQVGMSPGMADIPVTRFLAKEIRYAGAFRFKDEFITAVQWLEKGLIDPGPLLTRVFDYRDIVEAITYAADKTQAFKVQISFDE